MAEAFVANALSPAKIKSVKIEGEKATITIHSEQKPKVIGKDGVNIRLASMLLGLELIINDIGAENLPKLDSSALDLANAAQNANESAQDEQLTKEQKEEMFKALFKE